MADPQSGSLIAKLIADMDERPFKVVSFPRRDGATVALWCLSMEEELLARKRAFKYVNEVLKFSELDLSWDENQALTDARVVEILAVAMRDPENRANAASTGPDEVRLRLSAVTLSALFREYQVFQGEQDDFEQVKDPVGTLGELVDHLKKARPISGILSRYATPSVRALLLTAVDRLARQPDASSSDTSLSSDSGH